MRGCNHTRQGEREWGRGREAGQRPQRHPRLCRLPFMQTKGLPLHAPPWALPCRRPALQAPRQRGPPARGEALPAGGAPALGGGGWLQETCVLDGPHACCGTTTPLSPLPVNAAGRGGAEGQRLDCRGRGRGSGLPGLCCAHSAHCRRTLGRVGGGKLGHGGLPLLALFLHHTLKAPTQTACARRDLPRPLPPPAPPPTRRSCLGGCATCCPRPRRFTWCGTMCAGKRLGPGGVF